MKVALVFPHQLFEHTPLLAHCDTIYLVEEFLFFKQYSYHQQKIAFHRASMKFYEQYLLSKNVQVVYVNAQEERADVRVLIPQLAAKGLDVLHFVDTTDCWLQQRIAKACKEFSVQVHTYSSPLFLNSSEEIELLFQNKKRYFQTDFYKQQRQQRNILLDEHQKPIGGKWTFDDENRLKYPKGKIAPKVEMPLPNEYYQEALSYTQKNFPANYGHLNPDFIYPTTFEESKDWLQEFFKKRFAEFGLYEDAILAGQSILNHSVLTPMLNVGLLLPQYVLEECLKYAAANNVPINSVEGFVRQIMGWREFIRAMYQLKGSEERTRNYWGFKRAIPASFWTGDTGIEPIDQTIRKVLQTGYCHHIERLMVLGNFMLLCEFDPNEVYRWFMELFIDAYDWVMVPNVYGMSQFADAGLFATKPYISGSNYLMKMSDYAKGDWQAVWDALFWRFMYMHRSFFTQNPRLGMLITMFDKMPIEKQNRHLTIAAEYLNSLS